MKHTIIAFCCMAIICTGQAHAAVPLVSTDKLQPPQSPFFYSSDQDSEVWGIRNPKPQTQTPKWNIPSPDMPFVPIPIIIMPDKPMGKPAPVQPIVR